MSRCVCLLVFTDCSHVCVPLLVSSTSNRSKSSARWWRTPVRSCTVIYAFEGSRESSAARTCTPTNACMHVHMRARLCMCLETKIEVMSAKTSRTDKRW